MEPRIQLNTWRCGLEWLGNEIGWEFWWIGGEPGEKQFVVGKVIEHGLPMNFYGLLEQLEDCIGIEKICMIKIASCDGKHVGRLVSSLDCDVAHMILQVCACVVFDTGG